MDSEGNKEICSTSYEVHWKRLLHYCQLKARLFKSLLGRLKNDELTSMSHFSCHKLREKLLITSKKGEAFKIKTKI